MHFFGRVHFLADLIANYDTIKTSKIICPFYEQIFGGKNFRYSMLKQFASFKMDKYIKIERMRVVVVVVGLGGVLG